MKKGYFAIKLRYVGYILLLLWNVMLVVVASSLGLLGDYDFFGYYNDRYPLLAFLLANWLVAFLIMFYFEVVKARASLLLNSDFNSFYSTIILPSKHRDT